MDSNGQAAARQLVQTEDDIDPQRLYMVYDSQIFHHLWYHARHDIPPAPEPGQTYTYVVAKVVKLRDAENRIQTVNQALPQELSYTRVQTIGQFSNPHDASEFALIRFHRLNVLLRAQYIEPSALMWNISGGCIGLNATFNINSFYAVLVTKQLIYLPPVQGSG
ncbi:hypothetical protein F4823DRAFT_224436 [Ustulina deusta]|nr:hypothetical protein F4823DRAFT_224436 [Ustulina deusta]